MQSSNLAWGPACLPCGRAQPSKHTWLGHQLQASPVKAGGRPSAQRRVHATPRDVQASGSPFLRVPPARVVLLPQIRPKGGRGFPPWGASSPARLNEAAETDTTQDRSWTCPFLAILQETPPKAVSAPRSRREVASAGPGRALLQRRPRARVTPPRPAAAYGVSGAAARSSLTRWSGEACRACPVRRRTACQRASQPTPLLSGSWQQPGGGANWSTPADGLQGTLAVVVAKRNAKFSKPRSKWDLASAPCQVASSAPTGQIGLWKKLT